MNIRSIWIEVTTRCNLNCTICGKDKNGRDMSIELFTKIADQCVSKAEEVNITGVGEATITKHFHEMCSLVLNKYNKRLIMITNGQQLNIDDRLLDLLIHDNVHLVFSIDGIGNTYEKIRVGAKWSNLIEVITKINIIRRKRNSKLKLAANFCLNRANMFQLQDIIKKASLEWKFDYLCVILLQPWFKNIKFFKENSPIFFMEETNAVLENAEKIARNVGLEIILPDKFDLEKKKNKTLALQAFNKSINLFRQIKWSIRNTPVKYFYKFPNLIFFKFPGLYRFFYDIIRVRRISCNVPFERLFFRVGGEVTPCCALNNYVIGSLLNSSVDNILRSLRYQTMVNNISKGYLPIECFKCQLSIGINKGNPNKQV